MNDIVKTIEKIIDKKEQKSVKPCAGNSTGAAPRKSYEKIGNFTS